MLTKVYYAIIAALLSATIFTGYLSYNFYGQKQVLSERLDQSRLIINEKERELSLLLKSQTISADTTAQAAKQAEELNETLGSLVEAIDDLEKPVQEKPNAKPATPSTPSANDLQLQRLLDAAYCTANPDDSSCSPKGA